MRSRCVAVHACCSSSSSGGGDGSQLTDASQWRIRIFAERWCCGGCGVGVRFATGSARWKTHFDGGCDRSSCRRLTCRPTPMCSSWTGDTAFDDTPEPTAAAAAGPVSPLPIKMAAAGEGDYAADDENRPGVDCDGVHGHFFCKKMFHRPTYCHHCTDMLWGLIGQGYMCEGE